MHSRRNATSQAVLHLSTLAITGGLAWLLGMQHERLSAAIAVTAILAAACWAVLGSLWWVIASIFRRFGPR